MQLQITYFLNSCDHIITNFLSWLSNFEVQRSEYTKIGDVRTLYDEILENFTAFCSYALNTSEYKFYATHPAIRRLKKLYELTNQHWYQTQEIVQLTEEKLFNDSKWIEIRDLAKETKKALEQFVKEERKKDIANEK